jgi:hypothetical protein
MWKVVGKDTPWRAVINQTNPMNRINQSNRIYRREAKR